MPSETVEALRSAVEGLTYQTETDAPWEVVSWSSSEDVPAGDEQTLDEFFAPLVEDRDWYGEEEKAVAARYRHLLGVLRQLLSDPKVLRVGETVYVAGRVKDGGWAGVKTRAVET